MVDHIRYVMKGVIDSPPYSEVSWSVWDTPDFTGAQSGFTNLINIEIDYQVINDVTSGGGNSSNPTPVIPSPPTPIIAKIEYVMKALLNAPPYEMVNWKVYNTPDFTGAQSGYPISSLTDIAVDYTVVDDVSRGPQALPVYILPSGPAGGDLSGDYPDPIVVGIQTVPVSDTAPTVGQALVFDGTEYVPTTTAVVTLAGDVTGLPTANTVEKIRNINVTAGTPTDGYVLTYVSGATSWQAKPSTGTSITFAGDLSGTTTSQNVLKIHGATVPIAGSLTIGNVLQVSGSSTLTYASLNLAGGANYITGVLPAANQAAQILTGDASGTTAAVVVDQARGLKSATTTVSVSGATAPTSGQVLTASNSTTATWATPSATTSVTMGGDVTGNSATSTVVKINGTSVPATPTTGQVLTATSGTTATWQTPSTTVTLAGDVTGSSSANSVVKIQNKTLASALSTIGAAQDGYVLTWVNGSTDWEAKPTSGSGVTFGGDLTGTSGSQKVVALTGPSGGGNQIPVTASGFTFDTSVTSPLITQTQSVATNGQNLTIYAQTAASSGVGGQLRLKAGTGASGGGDAYVVAGDTALSTGTGGTLYLLGGKGTTDGQVHIGIGTIASPISYITIANTGTITLSNLSGSGSGFVAVDNAGLLSFVSGISPSGAAGGDLAGNYPNPTVTQARGLKSATTTISVSAATAPSADQVLTATNSTTATWQTITKINGATVPAAGSLTTGNGLYVSGSSALTYSSLNLAGGSGWVTGLLPVANQSPQTLTGDASGTTATVVVDQARGLKSATTTVSVSAATAPSSGQVLTATSSTTATWQTGSLTLAGDVTGSSGSNTVVKITGSGGIVNFDATIKGDTSTPLKYGVTAITMTNADYTLSSSEQAFPILSVQGGSTLTADRNIILPLVSGAMYEVFNFETAGFNLTFKGATGVGVTVPYNSRAIIISDGVNYVPFSTVFGNASASVTSDISGTNQSQTVNKINGTSVPATPSANQVLVATGSTAATWQQIVNAQIGSSAAIAVSKLAAGTSGQILLNTATPTPTWTTVSGDSTISATGVVTVTNINGASVSAAGSLTTGNGLYVTGASALTYSALNLAGGTNYVTGVLPSANQASQTMLGDVTGTTAASSVVKIQGKTLASSLASVGATQDGYVLTWVNAASDWEAKPQTGGGGSGVTTVAAIDTSPNSNGLYISGTSISTQTASASNIGMVSTTTQSFAGVKTFTSNIIAGASTLNNTLTGGLIESTFSLATNLTLADGYNIILVDTSSARSITLPSPVNGRMFIIKDVIGSAETNNITLIRNASEKIEGIAASRILKTNWGVWRIVSNGTDWFII